MEEMQVFKTKFFQRLCREREEVLAELYVYRFFFLILYQTLKDEGCDLPPSIDDLMGDSERRRLIRDRVLEVQNALNKRLSKSDHLSVEHVIVEKGNLAKIEEKITPISFSDIKKMEEEKPGADYVSYALSDLERCYHYLRENITHILDEISRRDLTEGHYPLVEKFFNLEKRFRYLTRKHYDNIAFASFMIYEARRTRFGLKGKKERKLERKRKFIQLLQDMKLYEKEKLRSLREGRDKKTKMVLIENAKKLCDLTTDRSIENYLKEIFEELSQ